MRRFIIIYCVILITILLFSGCSQISGTDPTSFTSSLPTNIVQPSMLADQEYVKELYSDYNIDMTINTIEDDYEKYNELRDRNIELGLVRTGYFLTKEELDPDINKKINGYYSTIKDTYEKFLECKTELEKVEYAIRIYTIRIAISMGEAIELKIAINGLDDSDISYERQGLTIVEDRIEGLQGYAALLVDRQEELLADSSNLP